MNTGVREITIHTIYFSQVAASALRAYIHLQFLVSTVLAVSQRQIDSLIKTHLHSPADQCFYRFQVIVYGVLHILDFTPVTQIPKSFFQILLLNRGNILRHMTMEAIAHILPVGNSLYNTVFIAELLYLQST